MGGYQVLQSEQVSPETMNTQAAISGLQNLLGIYQKRKQDKFYRSAAAKMLGFPESDIPEGAVTPDTYGALLKEKLVSKNTEWKPKTQGEAIAFEQAKNKPSESTTFREKLKNVIGGGDTWDALKSEYPDRTDTITKLENKNTPADQNTSFSEANPMNPIDQIKAWISPDSAVLTSTTKKVIGNINTKADLEEFVKDEAKYKKAGVDTKSVREYFKI